MRKEILGFYAHMALMIAASQGAFVDISYIINLRETKISPFYYVQNYSMISEATIIWTPAPRKEALMSSVSSAFFTVTCESGSVFKR